MADTPELIVSVTIFPTTPDEAARAVEALARAAAGLALDGIGSALNLTPLDEDGVAREFGMDTDEDDC